MHGYFAQFIIIIALRMRVSPRRALAGRRLEPYGLPKSRNLALNSSYVKKKTPIDYLYI